MDLNQLIIAAIGASSTLLAAWLSTRGKQKTGVATTKRSARRTVTKFAIYFLLGGAATYWAMNWLLPFGRIDERLSSLESSTQSLIQRIGGFGQGSDSVSSGVLPIGSVILSILPPERFGQLPGASATWVPADGRMLDSLSRYTLLTGNRQIPDLRTRIMTRGVVDSTLTMDSLQQRLMPVNHQGQGGDTSGRPALYWYVRIN